MQKLIKRISATEEHKLFILYGIAIVIVSLIVIASAVVLNASALLAKPEDVDAEKNLNPQELKLMNLSGEPISSSSEEMFAAQVAPKIKPITVTVRADKEEYSVELLNATVADAINMAGVKLYEEDSVNMSLNTPLKNGDEIIVTRAFDVTVKADNKNYKIRMAQGTVADALVKAGVKADGDDIVSPPIARKISENTIVKVSRVTYKKVRETVVVAYKTVTQNSGKMNVGNSKVTQKGVNGSKVCTYKVKYIDGKKINSKLIKEVVTKKAVTKKVTVGTKSVKVIEGKKAPAQISLIHPPKNILFKNGLPTSYKKVIRGKATAYGPQDGTTTSTGVKAKPGYVAVDPKIIPYGTKMYIVSSDGRYNYGYAIAADTGGACRQGKILVDLFFNSSQACINFGRRNVTIYIL